MKRIKLLSTLMIGLLGLMGIRGAWLFTSQVHQLEHGRLVTLEQRELDWQLLQTQVQSRIDGFPGEVGLMIKDLDTGYTIVYNETKSFPAASIIKLPIMTACLKAAECGQLNLADILRTDRKSQVGGSGVLWSKPPGTPVSIESLIDVMIAQSDNQATNMLIDHMGGMNPLNLHMKELGLQQSVLTRKMMDFRARARGIENYTSAADIGGVLEGIYRGEILDKTRTQMALDILKHQKYRDRIPAQLPRDVVVAHKTGLENNIVHDAGIVYTPNGNFMVCVLTRSPALYRDAKHLIGWISYDVYQYMLRSKNLDEFKLFPNVGVQSVS